MNPAATEADLVAKARAGSAEAFGRLVGDHQQRSEEHTSELQSH